jgi:4-diphosphocytidyl-2-C-methyl-D-erythritol kinase
MLHFPNSKLNLGLRILRKRADGFHDIDTVFYPVSWCDALELLEDPGSKEAVQMSFSGIPVSGEVPQNLVYRACKMISDLKKIPPVKIHLHKSIPMGAGLGGGSADAAFIIKMLDEKFSLQLGAQKMKELASCLGSDCAFFIENTPLSAAGKGDRFSEIQVSLKDYYILIIYPGIHSDTAGAYRGIQPDDSGPSVAEVIKKFPIIQWKDHLVNHFEKSVFARYPEIGKLKQKLYASGAVYSSMSGSGSAVFGIFEKKPEINFPQHYNYFLQNPVNSAL